MDIDLATEVLFELMKKEILEVVFPGQIRRKPEECGAADQQKGNEGDNDTSWGHSDAPV